MICCHLLPFGRDRSQNQSFCFSKQQLHFPAQWEIVENLSQREAIHQFASQGPLRVPRRMTPVQLGQTPKQQMRRLELLQWQEQRQEQQAAEEASATAAAAGAATSSAALPNPVGAAHGRGGVRANAGRKRTRFGPPTLAEFMPWCLSRQPLWLA